MNDYVIRFLDDMERHINTLSMPPKARNILLGEIAGVRTNLGLEPAAEETLERRRYAAAGDRVRIIAASNRPIQEVRESIIQTMKDALHK